MRGESTGGIVSMASCAEGRRGSSSQSPLGHLLARCWGRRFYEHHMNKQMKHEQGNE